MQKSPTIENILLGNILLNRAWFRAQPKRYLELASIFHKDNCSAYTFEEVKSLCEMLIRTNDDEIIFTFLGACPKEAKPELKKITIFNAYMKAIRHDEERRAKCNLYCSIFSTGS